MFQLRSRRNKNKIAMKAYASSLKKMKRYVGNTTTYLSDLLETGNLLFKSKFIGVYNSDEIPNGIPKGTCFIVNVDGKNDPGSHWLAVCKENSTDVIWVYDSFGRNIHQILPKIYNKGRIVKTTDKDAEQSTKESNCGARSLAFIDVFIKYGPDIASYI